MYNIYIADTEKKLESEPTKINYTNVEDKVTLHACSAFYEQNIACFIQYSTSHYYVVTTFKGMTCITLPIPFARPSRKMKVDPGNR